MGDWERKEGRGGEEEDHGAEHGSFLQIGIRLLEIFMEFNPMYI